MPRSIAVMVACAALAGCMPPELWEPPMRAPIGPPSGPLGEPPDPVMSGEARRLHLLLLQQIGADMCHEAALTYVRLSAVDRAAASWIAATDPSVVACITR